MAKVLTLPLDADAVRALRAGEEVLVSGRAVTAREAAHRRLLEAPDEGVRRVLRGGALYHCGPVVAQDPYTKAWRFVAAGPTASVRMEPWTADVMAAYGPRVVLGKGGMGPRTLAALRAHGAVYLHAAGGLAVTLARHVSKVHAVHGLDALGVTDAIWEIELDAFPAVVTMDAHGDTLHARPEPPRQAEAGPAGE
ncbi:MAG TPA: FumA C-terminus/TtdB family hydratase beta subunit [Anaeromyxobacter sp.]|nr:FumA C-terminus/TtdB family hydratase beta subunit [Anaeromyxobacter sp.]